MQMPERNIEMPRCVGGGVAMSLGEPHAVDLGPDQRAVGDVEILQRLRSRVGGEAAVLVQEEIAEVFATQELQIHGQKGGVVDRVNVSKIVIKLQAVQNLRAVR